LGVNWLARYFDAGEDAFQGAVGVEAFDFGFGFEDDAVAHDGRDEHFDVVGDDVVAALEGS
jgi:hypothetical protein